MKFGNVAQCKVARETIQTTPLWLNGFDKNVIQFPGVS
jgi:hypothetical protein